MTTRTTRIATGLIAASLATVFASGAAQAALIDRGGGLIYDDVLNVTWLQDANYAKTSGQDTDGKMNWTAANAWAADLSYYDSVRNVTYTDWRLPTMQDTGTRNCNFNNVGTDCGWNVQTVSGSTVYSEMAYMYYTNLGLKAYYSPVLDPNGIDFVEQANYGIFGNGTTGGQNNVGLINNLQSSAYWSGLPAAFPAGEAWYFQTEDGAQNMRSNTVEYYAWAVRVGDVAAVPEAQTYALMLAGLGLIGWRARRRG